MIVRVIDEGIKSKERFENIPTLSKAEIKAALEYVISKIEGNLVEFTNAFPPPASTGNVYTPGENTGWTTSFWTGMIWMAYEITGDDKFRKAAEIQCKSFKERIEKGVDVNHHDLGFLYSLSCVAGYRLTGNEEMKETALKAADKLITRYKEKGEFIQAWGALDNPEAYRLIIDCMLNLPLLYWASEVTGDDKYAVIAAKHAVTAVKTVIREDSSTYHTYYFDLETGSPKKGVTHQGYSDDSAWARGQAWGIYGFPLSFIYTGKEEYITEAEKLANYFLNRLPEDYVCYWDLIFTEGDEQERDSSAAAIAVCGMHEILKHRKDEYTTVYENGINAIMRSLIDNYTTKDTPESNGILLHGVYGKPQKSGVDECCIWGDYYYMEALMRLNFDWKLYW